MTAYGNTFLMKYITTMLTAYLGHEPGFHFLSDTVELVKAHLFDGKAIDADFSDVQADIACRIDQALAESDTLNFC